MNPQKSFCKSSKLILTSLILLYTPLLKRSVSQPQQITVKYAVLRIPRIN